MNILNWFADCKKKENEGWIFYELRLAVKYMLVCYYIYYGFHSLFQIIL